MARNLQLCVRKLSEPFHNERYQSETNPLGPVFHNEFLRAVPA